MNYLEKFLSMTEEEHQAQREEMTRNLNQRKVWATLVLVYNRRGLSLRKMGRAVSKARVIAGESVYKEICCR